MQFLANEISRNTYVNVMAQYRPCGLAGDYPAINCGLAGDDYRRAVEAAERAGIRRLDSRAGRRIVLRRLFDQ
jgi:putative pyruvate formate lyase activating enzyme